MEMDIDTGNSTPIASRPYTLPLKHYECMQKEISTLERAGIITKSISPWASPVVIMPQKSTPGESVPSKLTLGCPHYPLTDVPPQSNSPPDTVLGSDCPVAGPNS